MKRRNKKQTCNARTEILRCIAAGKTRVETIAELGIRPYLIIEYLSSLRYRSFGPHEREQALAARILKEDGLNLCASAP